MNNAPLKNKKVVVVGLGLTGQSCVRFALDQGAQVSAMDSRAGLKVDLGIEVHLGSYSLQQLLTADLVLISPGVDPAHPVIASAYEAGKEIIGDVELFARFNDRPVIAITGSNGKSTVTTLVAKMCEEGGMKTLLGGNIGKPVLELLDEDGDILVLELSSFQLETLSSLAPLAATVLNLSDDHLDRHGNMENYRLAKQRIYLNAEYKLANRDDPNTWVGQDTPSLSFGLGASEVGFSWREQDQTILFENQPFLSMQDCLLVGAHNALNIQAAAACAKAAQVDDAAIKRASQTFAGLPHRFETVSQKAQIRWINDSKATNVGATIAAIEGLKGTLRGKLLLIAGGDGKNADFGPLQEVLERQVALVITFGKDGSQIAALVGHSEEVADLTQAVQLAAQHATAGDVVLLSPACASLDMFDNYQQRGERFARAVEELAA